MQVYATVTDRDGLPVTGLSAGDFHVTEDQALQTIEKAQALQHVVQCSIELHVLFGQPLI